MTAFAKFFCTYVTIASLLFGAGSAKSSDRCQKLRAKTEGDLYRIFNRSLSTFKIDFSTRGRFETIKNEVLGHPYWEGGTAGNSIRSLRKGLGQLDTILRKMIPAPSKHSKNKQYQRQPIGLTIDQILAQSPTEKLVLSKIRTTLPKAYLLPSRQSYRKAVGLIRAFAQNLDRDRLDKPERESLREDLAEILAEIEIRAAEYEIRINNRAGKMKLIAEMLMAIETHCGESRNPEVLQSGTNLYWLRCPLGQGFNGTSCLGEKKKVRWNEAEEACPPGYRLPKREELTGLLGGCDKQVQANKYGYCRSCESSPLCAALFPGDTGFYWSSSAYDDNIVWRADFRDGYVCWGLRLNKSAVRCVGTGP